MAIINPSDNLVTTTELTDFQSGDAQSAIDRATADVRGECGWHIAPSRTETLKVRANGRTTILLPTLRVTDVAAVRVDGVALASEDFSCTPSGILARTSGPRVWTAGATVEVDLTHGYATTPEDLAGVVLARATRSQADPRGDIVRVQKGPFSEQYDRGDAAEAAVVDRYRIVRSR